MGNPIGKKCRVKLSGSWLEGTIVKVIPRSPVPYSVNLIVIQSESGQILVRPQDQIVLKEE